MKGHDYFTLYSLLFTFQKCELTLARRLENERAEYGRRIVATLASKLTTEFGKGWSTQQLKQGIWFARTYHDKEIGYTLCNQLSWSQIRLVLAIEDPLKRDFYIEMCRMERWSVRTLQERIASMLYERTAISKKPEETIASELALLKNEGKLTPEMVFRDPYFLDFLGLSEAYSEKDIESAILIKLQRFITEPGSDFSFVARQKRITVDGEDYYIDLLFFHRRLRRLIVIDLKMGRFKPADKGQMELYLRWLDKYERNEGEHSPLGLILCADKHGQNKTELSELLELDKFGIHVANYLVELPPRDLLEKELVRAMQTAREMLATKK